MEIYTVSFFGHRQIYDQLNAERRLKEIVEKLLREHSWGEFLVGREGDFDIMSASVVRQVRKTLYCDNASLIWILPYMKAELRDNKKNLLEYYDNIEIDSEASAAYFKNAIKIRNRRMVDRSQLVICYIDHNKGGAYTAVQYAQKIGREVVNIADEFIT